MADFFIGLMSGTSMDAIDAALVDFSKPPLQLIATHSEPIPHELKEELIAICHPGMNEINRMGELDVQLGQLFAKASKELIMKANVQAHQIRAIGSHGQTIRHQPKFQYPFTLQIADPNIIAAHTGITTVADFRRRDMALGGQGAPLAPAFHNHMFRSTEVNRVIANIGGIANITLLAADTTMPVTGFDTGPGNTLLDSWADKHINQACDMDGQWAASGTVIEELLNALLADPYFLQKPPKSTGREYFNLNWLYPKLKPHYRSEDVQATLVELTSQSLIYAIQQFGFENADVLVCGGGVHNKYLMKRLNSFTANLKFYSTQEVGVDPDWIEAMAFAWFAKLTLERKPANLPPVTGASDFTILGGVYFA